MVIYFFISEKKAKEETLLEENVPTVALETEDSAESEELVHNEDAS